MADPTQPLAAANLLRHETSTYLLQHSQNPVHWRPWSPAALAEAVALDKPILLSIGYAACHWCHVMAHESFEDADTAAVMNALFVNIKVDREERPDIDQLYMAALHAFGEQGGWPLTMFLTPAAKPIWGGTYFPPKQRYGRPGFPDVLREIAALYRERRDDILAQADKVTAHLAAHRTDAATGPLDGSIRRAAADAILEVMDLERGGTRGAPKFPNAPVTDFLARSAETDARPHCAQAVEATLLGLCNGGIYDHAGGGISRYSTDQRWLVPHFEKMLYDNGQFLEQLALAIPHSQHAPLFRSRIEQTVGFLQRELKLPDGGFAAGLDADSEGVEGKFYVWQRAELDEVLGTDDASFLAALYDVQPGGNWEGHAILNRLDHPAPLSPADEARCARLLSQLFAHRAIRTRPQRDEQALVDWNGLVITGLAVAGMALGRSDWIEEAASTYGVVVQRATRSGRLHHVADLRSDIRAFSTDLANLARAALALHPATGDWRWIAEAADRLAALERHHGDGAGGYYLAPDDADGLILRKNEKLDEATPNAHGVAAEAYIRLWALTGDDEYRVKADAILSAAAPAMRGNVFATASLLAALDLRLRVVSLVLIVPEVSDASPLMAAIRTNWRRNLVLDRRSDSEPLPPHHPAAGKIAVGGQPTAYLCREGSCSLPLTDPDALSALIRQGGAADQVFI